MSRQILHVDMDAFYASIEQRDTPSLKGKPIVVGNPPEKRGVVCSPSYEARKFGIKSGMSTVKALKLCPSLIIIKPNFKKYEQVSNELIKIYKMFTDKIEPLSLDECFLDVTNNKLNMTALDVAKAIKGTIKLDLKLTASVGIAPNKLLAKIASDINKPDGLFIINENEIENFMHNLDVSKLWGVGKVTYEKLKEMNIYKCSDLQKLSLVELSNLFGIFGETLYYFARGIDTREVTPFKIEKSMGEEKTFSKDINDPQLLHSYLKKVSQKISEKLKNIDAKAKTVVLKIKYYNFTIKTRSKTLKYATDESEEIFNIGLKLLNDNYDYKTKIRLLGLSVKFENAIKNQLLLPIDF